MAIIKAMCDGLLEVTNVISLGLCNKMAHIWKCDSHIILKNKFGIRDHSK